MIYLKKLLISFGMSVVLSSHLVALVGDCDSNANNEYLVTTNSGDMADNNSLRACVVRACHDGQNSTILFNTDMTIVLDNHVDINIIDNNNTTIDGGSNNIVIDGNNAHRVIDASRNTGILTLKNLTLKNGNTGGNGGAILLNGDIVVDNCTIKDNNAACGAGIYADSATNTITIKNSTLYRNRAITDSGGGLYISDNEIVIIENSTFSQNTAASDGGGLYSDNNEVITIKNSTFIKNATDAQGGAIKVRGTLSIENSTITENTATLASGIYAVNSTLDINNTTISKNTATTHIGGIYANNSTVNINNSAISENTATNNNVGGVSLVAMTTATINNSTITDNTAGDEAGGIYADDSNININNSTISRNTAAIVGGLMFQTASNVDINNSTISDNTATTVMGGIVIVSGSMTIQHSTISGNTAANHAGGLYTDGANIDIKNSTISGNTATTGNGGGIYVDSCPVFSVESSTITDNSAGITAGGIFNNAGGTWVTIENTILARNSATTSPDADEVQSLGYNLVGNITNFIGYNANIDQNNTDPKLGPLADNGGNTETHALLVGSPAINAGNTALTTDQRGLPRTGLDDIGAYEAQSSGVVNAPAFIDAYVDNKAKGAANELPVASTALSSSTKVLMALLFAGIAFFGFRRKNHSA